MLKHDIFHAYQAHIAGTDYIAIPRGVGREARVEIQLLRLLRPPGIDDVIGAIVAADGKLIEASKLTASRTGHEYLQTIDANALPEQLRNAFQRIAAAVVAHHPAPVPYAAIDVLSLPRKHLTL
jgi:hypothetical protein